MIIAQQVAESLYRLGIRRVYGLPGEDHMALLDSFQTAGLEYCTAFNESSAVIMAATDAQLTGLPGVVVLSLAPGVSNGVNGVLNTYLEEVPLILISGQHPAGQLPFVVRQGFNIERLVTPITKWQAKVTADMNVPSVLGKAVDEAMSGRPGPVYLEIPDAVATSESKADDEAARRGVARLRARWVDAQTQVVPADPAVIDGLAARLEAGAPPGAGARRTQAPRSPRPLSTRSPSAFRVPVFTSTRQKGVLSSASEFFAGAFLNGRLEKEIFDRSDLVLMIDPESFDFYNKAWTFSADAVALTDAGYCGVDEPVRRPADRRSRECPDRADPARRGSVELDRRGRTRLSQPSCANWCCPPTRPRCRSRTPSTRRSTRGRRTATWSPTPASASR